MLIELTRHLLFRRRLQAARQWQEAERVQAAEHSEAIRRILDQDRGITPALVVSPWSGRGMR